MASTEQQRLHLDQTPFLTASPTRQRPSIGTGIEQTEPLLSRAQTFRSKARRKSFAYFTCATRYCIPRRQSFCNDEVCLSRDTAFPESATRTSESSKSDTRDCLPSMTLVGPTVLMHKFSPLFASSSSTPSHTSQSYQPSDAQRHRQMPRLKAKSSGGPAQASSSLHRDRDYQNATPGPSSITLDHGLPVGQDITQSLKLDLQGIDLGGQRTRSRESDDSHLSSSQGQTKSSRSNSASERRPVSPKKSVLNLRGRLPLRSNSTIEEDDTFAMHLRDCEGAQDITTLDAILQRSNLGSAAPKLTEGGRPAVKNSEQVLGGFASLGLVESRPRMSSSKRPSSAKTVASLGDQQVSLLKSHYNDDTPNAWCALSPQSHDPSNVLDIPSIDEMGLHSINVGSAQDWRGSLLTTDPRAVAGCCKAAAEWAIARSRKTQRKWIISPCQSSSLTAERTVVVSDYVAEGQQSAMNAQSSAQDERPKPFSGKAVFELRFLQAGKTAPGHTIHLTTPGMQKSLQRRQHENHDTANAPETSQGDAWTAETCPTASKGPDNLWPSLRQQNLTIDTAALPESRRPSAQPTLTHTRSASTIVAPTTPCHTDSRRPSLGKSMSHDGLEPGPLTMTSAISDERQGDGNGDDADSASQSRSTTVDSALISGMAAQSVSPFGSYMMGTQDLVRNISSSCESAGPSPRTSVLELPSTSPTHSDPEMKLDPLASGLTQDITVHPVLERIETVPRLQGRISSPASPDAPRRASARREKRIGEWLRRKVMPSSPPPLPPLMSPPLLGAWQGVTTASDDVDRSALSASAQPIKISSRHDNSDSDYGISSDKAALPSPDTDSRPNTAPEGRSLPPTVEFRSAAKLLPSLQQSMLGTSSFRRRSSSNGVLDAKRDGEPVSDRSALQVAPARRRAGTASSKGSAGAVDVSTTRGAEQINDGSGRQAETFFAHSPPSTGHGNVGTTAPAIAELIGIEEIPGGAMTMLIPLPICAGASQWRAPRYMRVSYAPFDEDNEASSMYHKAGHELTETSATSPRSEVHGHSHAWLKRLGKALSANDRSSDSDTCDDTSATHYGMASTMSRSREAPKDANTAASMTTSRKAFRITAKMLVGNNTIAGASHSDVVRRLLPPISSFPIILGVCDARGRIDLVPEGWHQIGLGAGPAPTYYGDVLHPLCGVADLIIAGCVACMDL